MRDRERNRSNLTGIDWQTAILIIIILMRMKIPVILMVCMLLFSSLEVLAQQSKSTGSSVFNHEGFMWWSKLVISFFSCYSTTCLCVSVSLSHSVSVSLFQTTLSVQLSAASSITPLACLRTKWCLANWQVFNVLRMALCEYYVILTTCIVHANIEHILQVQLT